MGRTLRPPSLCSQWARSRQLIDRCDSAEEDCEDIDRAINLEALVLNGRIGCLADAVAKLKAVELSFVEGERTDGADGRALRQTIDWLEAQASWVRQRPRSAA